ncbi:3-phosphoshikimate 1-carboxyvinyltransferase [Nitratiruptor sp. YY08-26]|uniref:3-phosphoshikimate 1-carboxyvinyltransferase n=1 Tax=unclassified Nitratiruptor TaxID=2624044 RepID=UPI0019169194|nr:MULTISPECIES: 3-phosphoshikimate 1-carboxyvinyltransferase [unclassified Nitratiruptor]BCD61901.1 3-phosphoshikimate 1-carboxyvinyltransferase [Nitratiruptor sp. YY08-13]BCD65836.1 3-phosphoshikimate 1-carboxyvinyltransferase [Nitratiruptor sp. YY08-26]
MSRLKIAPKKDSFNIEIAEIAPDKSISHRAAMFSLLSNKPSKIRNFLKAEDTLNTLQIVKKLGAKVEEGDIIKIEPPKNIVEPDDVLDCGNSGTGMRLYCGFLAGIEGFFVLSGDKYLRNRPMARVAKPLRSIGAKIDGREEGNKAPLAIRGNAHLESFFYESPIASAQVKSALILAGLRAKEASSYSEPELSRDHTERMLRGMGANIKSEYRHGKYFVEIEPLKAPLEPLDITIPSDPSSAFFFAVAAAIMPGSCVLLKNITLNPTRIEAFKVLQKMGAKVEYMQKENIYEPIGDIRVCGEKLQGVEVSEHISWLIDELPALAIAMAVAEGVSRVKNAKELRVKESDRIKSVVENLRKCGISVEEYEDGYEIRGGKLQKAVIDSYGDHRIAMSFAIAGLLVGMEIEDIECIATSFPNFVELLQKITEVERGD